MNSTKKIIRTTNAPEPIGPYSQAVEYQGLLYCSGQIALDPATGNLIQDNITAETHQVMKNIEAVLREAGVGFDQVIKTTIFLTDMDFFGEVNAVYGSYFTQHFPARETIAVKGLPKGVRVEISVLAGSIK